MSTPISVLVKRARLKQLNFNTEVLSNALSDAQWSEIAKIVEIVSSETANKEDLVELLARAPQMWLYKALNHNFAGVPKQTLLNSFRELLLELSAPDQDPVSF